MSQGSRKCGGRKGEAKVKRGRPVKTKERGYVAKAERRDHGHSVSAATFYSASCNGRTIQLTSDLGDKSSVPLPACASESVVSGLRHGRQKVLSPGRG